MRIHSQMPCIKIHINCKHNSGDNVLNDDGYVMNKAMDHCSADDKGVPKVMLVENDKLNQHRKLISAPQSLMFFFTSHYNNSKMLCNAMKQKGQSWLCRSS